MRNKTNLKGTYYAFTDIQPTKLKIRKIKKHFHMIKIRNENTRLSFHA